MDGLKKEQVRPTTSMPYSSFEFAGLECCLFLLELRFGYSEHWGVGLVRIGLDSECGVRCPYGAASKPTHKQTGFGRNRENMKNTCIPPASLCWKHDFSVYTFLTKTLELFSQPANILDAFSASMLYIQTKVQCEDLEPDFCAASLAVGLVRWESPKIGAGAIRVRLYSRESVAQKPLDVFQ